LYKAWHLKFAETIIIIVFLEGDLTGLEMHNKTLSLGLGAEGNGNLLVGVLLVIKLLCLTLFIVLHATWTRSPPDTSLQKFISPR